MSLHHSLSASLEKVACIEALEARRLLSFDVPDVNGDGILDQVTVENVQGVYYYDSELVTRLGNGDGTFAPAVRQGINFTGVPSYLDSIIFGDVNADSKLDAVAIVYEDTSLSFSEPFMHMTLGVMLGKGDGTFVPRTVYRVGYPIDEVVDIKLHSPWLYDDNGDGNADLSVGETIYEYSGAVIEQRPVFLGNGDGSFQVPVSVSVSDETVTEGNTGSVNATFTLTLTRATNVDVTVQFDTTNITAAAGSDYAAASDTVTIPAGQTSQTFTVAVNGDRLPESAEAFAVNLSAPTNATIGDGQGFGTILDNEPRISINNVSRSEGNGKTATFTFTVRLSAAYDQAVTVSYATTNGTATAGTDYTAKSGAVTFAPGETIKTITVVVKGDKQKEANETFFVDLFGPSNNALIGVGRGIGTVLDDDNR